jgi:hypothetical protein
MKENPCAAEADVAVPFWIDWLHEHHRADTTGRGSVVVKTVDGDALAIAMLQYGLRPEIDIIW